MTTTPTPACTLFGYTLTCLSDALLILAARAAVTYPDEYTEQQRAEIDHEVAMRKLDTPVVHPHAEAIAWQVFKAGSLLGTIFAPDNLSAVREAEAMGGTLACVAITNPSRTFKQRTATWGSGLVPNHGGPSPIPQH